MAIVEKNILNLIKSSLGNLYGAMSGLDYYLEIPRDQRYGDFSTNIAMRLSREYKKPAMDIASGLILEMNSLSKNMDLSGYIKDIKAEKPGFINFYISDRATIEELMEMLDKGAEFGRLSIGSAKKVQIEFVSANPTGPLTVAHGRQAAIGDSLARILEFCGYKVVREYYINDEGVQISMLGESLKARLDELTSRKSVFPENGYKGRYVYDIAEKIIEGMDAAKINQLSKEFFMDTACHEIMKTIVKDLEEFGVHFDVWYSQKGLSSSGKIEQTIEILKDKGFLYEADGAMWFRSTDFEDDKDRVIIKQDGSYTYVMPDMAYHREKFEQGYDMMINIWGPDHHGYINRIKAGCQALGYDKDKLFILTAQLVTLFRNGKPVRMSTRDAEFITLREVMDEVGRDAARFFFIMRKRDSHLDFDLELAKVKNMDNPVYYIQYAHARIASVIEFSNKIRQDISSLQLLEKPEEINIIKTLMQFPKIIELSSKSLEPYTLLAYLKGLAGLFHSYYNDYRIVTENMALTQARIALIYTVKTVLSNGLCLLGVSAPEKM